MPNSIKYTTSTETKALRKGNFYIAIGDDPKAPTSQNGYWVGYDVPPGGYVTYINKESGGPSIYTSANDSDLISITNIIDSPSINFITNNPTPTTNTSGYSVVGGVGSLSLDESEMAIRWTRTSYETWGAYVLNNSLSNYQFDTFSSYTSTFEWKLGPLHTADTTYNFQIINGPSTYIILSVSLLSNSTLQENGWYRFTRNQIPPLDGSGETVQYRIITGSKGLLVTDIYWRGLEYRKTIKTNKEQCFNYFAGQSDKMVVNKQYPTIVTDGLVLSLDAGYLPSYPGTSSTWYDLGTYSNNGALTNGPTFNSSGWIEFDGVDDSQNWTTNPDYSSAVNTQIGRLGYPSFSRNFNGSIYKTLIYDRVLTSKEILQNYHQAPIVTDGLVFAVDAGNLVSYESGSTTTYQLTGTVSSGSLNNGVTFSPNSGGTWGFDGSDDFINFGNSAPTNFIYTDPFSLEAWLNPNALSGFKHIIGKTFGNYRLAQNGNAVSFRLDSNKMIFQTSAILTVGKWTHVIATWEPSTFTGRIYIDGNLAATSTNTNINWTSTTANFQIGNSPGENYYFNGSISLGRVYNRTLNSDEIIQNFKAQRSRFGI
jgi:hypothetical protein